MPRGKNLDWVVPEVGQTLPMDICRRAAVAVCDMARDADDARMLLDALGLRELLDGGPTGTGEQ
jgi:hypothetical protein